MVSVKIDTSADGTFYAAAHDFSVVITTGTADSVSIVGEVVGYFSIQNRSALRPTTAGRTLVVDASGLADANTVKVGPTGSGTAQTARDLGTSVLLSSGSGTGQITLSSGAVTVGTNNDKTGYTASTVSDKTGYALSSGGVQAIWDALTSAFTTVGSIGKKLADWTIGTAQTGDSFARIGAAGAGLTALGDARIANLDATISSRTKPADTQAAVTTVASVSGSVGSVTGLTASDVGSIKTQTDKLAFTVTNQVDANMKSINQTTITGDGQPGTEFGV